MKAKTLADTKEFKRLMRCSEAARKDPNFMQYIREFITYHSGRKSA